MATKADLAQLETHLLKWIFWITIGMGGAIITAMYYMIKCLPAIQTAIQAMPS